MSGGWGAGVSPGGARMCGGRGLAPVRDPGCSFVLKDPGFWRLGQVTDSPGAPHAVTTLPVSALLRPRARPPPPPRLEEEGPWAASRDSQSPEGGCAVPGPGPTGGRGERPGLGRGWTGLELATQEALRATNSRPCLHSQSAHRVPTGQSPGPGSWPASFLHSPGLLPGPCPAAVLPSLLRAGS